MSKALTIVGNEGKYISIVNGPIAASVPRSNANRIRLFPLSGPMFNNDLSLIEKLAYVCDEISNEESQVFYYITKMPYIKEG